MTKQIINLGTADKGNGDPLRVAFAKVNENFTEIFNSLKYTASDIAPEKSLGALWFNTIEGKLYVVYDDTWVDSNPTEIDPSAVRFNELGQIELPDGGGIVDINGQSVLNKLVNGDAELVLENDGTISSVLFPARGTGKIGISGNEMVAVPADPENTNPIPLVLTSQTGEVWISSNAIGPRPIWYFKQDGSIDVPVPQGGVFTLSLSSANFVPRVGKASLTLSGAPWVIQGQIVRNHDGTAELQLNQIFPQVNNPGYVTGDAFTFDDQVHHLFGYNLEIGLADVIQAGPAGWTANLLASPLPAYPSTVNSNGAIKLTANENSWTFGTNGFLTFPVGEVSIGTVPETQVTYFGSGVDGGGSISFSPTGNTYIVGSQNTVIDAGFGTESTKHWTFGTDGVLTMPDGSLGGNGAINFNWEGYNWASISSSESTLNLYSLDVGGGGPKTNVRIGANVELTTNLLDSAYTWTFGTDGTLNLPQSASAGNAIIQTTSAINLQVNSNGKIWTFGTDGRTIFPDANVPAHSYGAAGDKQGMVAFDSDYIYYCKLDYVNNSTNIWVRVAWTGTNW